jgi:hypothetical protein
MARIERAIFVFGERQPRVSRDHSPLIRHIFIDALLAAGAIVVRFARDGDRLERRD